MRGRWFVKFYAVKTLEVKNMNDQDNTLIDGCSAIKALFDEYSSEKYAAEYMHRRRWLRNAFKNYRSASSEVQSYLGGLVEQHAKCRTIGNAEYERRHNAFVMMYITERMYSTKKIARMQNITIRTLWNDLNRVLDDLMLLAFGVDGMKPIALSEQH